jgi:hypothetical protein
MFKTPTGVAALIVAGLACLACTDQSGLNPGGALAGLAHGRLPHGAGRWVSSCCHFPGPGTGPSFVVHFLVVMIALGPAGIAPLEPGA